MDTRNCTGPRHTGHAAVLRLGAISLVGLQLAGCPGVQTTPSSQPAPQPSNLGSGSAPLGSGPLGSATLRWSAPTQNADGSPVTALAGYHVHYGTSPTSTNTIDIKGAAVTTYTIGNLAPGTYYFSVSAYNAQGAESASSTIESKSF